MSALSAIADDFPVPRFRKGDKVWFAWTETQAAFHPCPDCNGTKVWSCTSPAGHTMEMQCPRCDRNSYDDLGLRYTKHTFGVRELTIGSIRINTDNVHNDHPVSYMCVETGVGSGTVYYENKLYATRAEAEEEHERLAAQRQEEHDATPQAMERLDYSRQPYFEARNLSLLREAERTVRAKLKSQIEADSPAADFTPGPWVAHGDTSDDGVFRWEVGAPDLSSEYGSWQIASGYGGLSSGFASREQGPANARLISAAPDLFSLAVYAVDNPRFDSAEFDSMARAVIARVRGEP